MYGLTSETGIFFTDDQSKAEMFPELLIDLISEKKDKETVKKIKIDNFMSVHKLPDSV